MLALKDLYQDAILDHSRQPRNFGKLEEANREARGHNPLCGDRLLLHLIVKDGIIINARFEGAGCAISTASASLMTDAIRGKKVEEVHALFKQFHQVLTAQDAPDEDTLDELGKLASLAGVREFPVRVKCATLAWHTLEAALANEQQSVSTE